MIAKYLEGNAARVQTLLINLIHSPSLNIRVPTTRIMYVSWLYPQTWCLQTDKILSDADEEFK